MTLSLRVDCRQHALLQLPLQKGSIPDAWLLTVNKLTRHVGPSEFPWSVHKQTPFSNTKERLEVAMAKKFPS